MSHKRTNQFRQAKLNKLNVALTAEKLRQTQFLNQLQQNFLGRIFAEDGEHGGAGILSLFEEQTGSLPIGAAAQAGLGQQQLAAQRGLERTLQERGLLGSGIEVAAQTQLGSQFGRASSELSEQFAQQRVQQNIDLTKFFTNQALGLQQTTPAASQVANLQAFSPARSSSPLAAIGGQIFGNVLGNLLPGIGNALGGAIGKLGGSIFGGSQAAPSGLSATQGGIGSAGPTL